MDFDKWMEDAAVCIAQIPRGTIFTLKDLFEGCHWNTLSKGDRLKFGKYFKNQVIMNMINGIVYLDTPSGKPAQYRKI